jgi:manganese/zinc/iron transport system substrate-binding protein
MMQQREIGRMVVDELRRNPGGSLAVACRAGARLGVLAWFGVLLAGLLVSGCGRAGEAGDTDGRITVVATTTMIADLARVLAGDDARVVGLMREGEDPHVYDVRPRDAQTIAAADLILMNGLNLEATLESVIRNNAAGRVVALAESDRIEVLDEADGSGAPDPHAWMDVANFKAYALAARDALIEIDPANAAGYRSRAERYLAELTELDAWVREQVETIPPDRRIVVTSHDAFNYFGEAYGVEVHAVIGISTEQQPRPQDVQALESLVRERGVRALFFETSVSPTLNQIVQKVADATGARIGGELYSDSLGAADGPTGTYIGMMRHNTSTIVEALR